MASPPRTATDLDFFFTGHILPQTGQGASSPNCSPCVAVIDSTAPFTRAREAAMAYSSISARVTSSPGPLGNASLEIIFPQPSAISWISFNFRYRASLLIICRSSLNL